MKAGFDLCSYSGCNEGHTAAATLLKSLRSTSKDLEASLNLVNRQIAKLQKKLDARRAFQMKLAMEEAQSLMARYGLNAKDLEEELAPT